MTDTEVLHVVGGEITTAGEANSRISHLLEAGAGVRVARSPGAWGGHRARVPDGVPGGDADVSGSAHDVHPGEQREHEEQQHGEGLPSGHHLFGFRTELDVDNEYCHPAK